MAFIDLNPTTITVNARRGTSQKFRSGIVTNFAGTALNLTTWASFQAKLVAVTASPNTADVNYGATTGGADGVLTVLMDASDLAANPAGTAQIVITGIPVIGDDPQLVATGSFNLANG